MTALVDRFRSLPAERRVAILDAIMATPGALSDLRYDWEGFWARDDQLVTLEEIRENPIVFFTGERGAGKTRSAMQLWLSLIRDGHIRRPRVFAATEADVAKVIIGDRKGHSKSKEKAEPEDGIMACMPRDERPEWLSDEGPAGVLRFRNGIEAVCFAATEPEHCVSHQGDGDLVDDIAKWKAHAHTAWFHQQASCRKGLHVTIVASTRRGTDLLRSLLGVGPSGPIPGVLIRRPPELDANRFNLAADVRTRVHAVAGGTLARQDIDDEDVGARSPFTDLPWEKIHVPAVRWDDLAEVVVAVDPAEGKGGDHDEWGIGAAGRRFDGHVVALEDRSGSYDDAEAGAIVLELCERRRATKIVVETNRGRAVLHAMRAAHLARELAALRADSSAKPQAMPELVSVKAKEGKVLRAGPLRTWYLDGLLHHGPGLDTLDKRGIEERSLERQMREWDPDGHRRPRSDDRIDWLVHAVTYLAKFEGEDDGAEAAAQCALAASMNARLVGRAPRDAPAPGATSVEPMKVEGAPPGDARYAGPPPRAVSRQANWRHRSVL